MARPIPPLTRELAALGLDLEGALCAEPRLLLDADFLRMLHAELAEKVAPEEARAALLQLGFLHGLRDALAVLRSGFAPLEPPTRGPAAARLAIRLAPLAGGAAWAGTWPEALEARARARSERSPEPEASGCGVSAGYTSGWLSGILDADVLALEESCRAAGHDACRFLAREARAWQEQGDARAEAALAALPFGALRELVVRQLEATPEPEPDGQRFQAGSPVIHVWGPVMILPFAGSDECLRSLELIGREPGARSVRVVIVDLGGALIDDSFGAASLEQVLEAIEGWGAEPLLTGISPLSERAVADLERTHLVIRKDLPEAIASAFQIAEAQRFSS
jgi:hypothetical protein